MTFTTKLVLALVGLLVLVGAGVGWSVHERQIGARDAEIKHLVLVNDSLRAREMRVDTVYRRDTVVLARTLTRYDTARVRDTVTRNDTVFVARAVADSAIRACTITLAECQEGWTLARARADSLAKLIPLIKQAQPSFWSRFRFSAGVAAIVAADDRKLHAGPGVAFGWTW